MRAQPCDAQSAGYCSESESYLRKRASVKDAISTPRGWSLAGILERSDAASPQAKVLCILRGVLSVDTENPSHLEPRMPSVRRPLPNRTEHGLGFRVSGFRFGLGACPPCDRRSRKLAYCPSRPGGFSSDQKIPGSRSDGCRCTYLCRKGPEFATEDSPAVRCASVFLRFPTHRGRPWRTDSSGLTSRTP